MKKYNAIRILGVAALLFTFLGGCAPTVVQLKTFQSNKLAIKELRTDQVDAVVGDYVVMAYEARESGGQLVVAGQQFDPETIGIGLAKTSGPLKDAVTAALAKIIENGQYDTSLLTWNITAAKIEAPPLSQNVLPSEEIVELKDGVLKVGMEISYPPMEFFDEIKQAAGVDVELARAIGAVLGVQVELVDMPFDALINAAETGKVDIVMSTMGITEERKAVIDFIPYLSMGSGILVKKGNPARIFDRDSLCGKRVAVQEAMSQVEAIKAVQCL